MPEMTPLYEWHKAHGGRVVDFAGWYLPVDYETGIIKEHLTCRKAGAFFDISHMGRFLIKGEKAVSFLRKALTNDCAKLKPGKSQYTILSDDFGSAIDDAFLYQFVAGEYLLVVNAANLAKDWDWLMGFIQPGMEMKDISRRMAMVAAQGPQADELMSRLTDDPLPATGRNNNAKATIAGCEVRLSRTGYTGEHVCYEVFTEWEENEAVWSAMVEAGSELGMIPAGLGARDTLRLEGSLPLYGHELAEELPIMHLPQAKFAVDLSPERGDFVGRDRLEAQVADLESGEGRLIPRRIMAVAATARSMIRDGSAVFVGDKEVGALTSATMVPAWEWNGQGPGRETFTRGLGLAYLDRDLEVGQELEIAYRRKRIPGKIVKGHTKPEGPFVRALKV